LPTGPVKVHELRTPFAFAFSPSLEHHYIGTPNIPKDEIRIAQFLQPEFDTVEEQIAVPEHAICVPATN
jgi:hypothetical protein